MPAFRFLHSADVHLGRRFGRFPDEARAALAAARRDTLKSLAEAAHRTGAAHVLIAGDLFDTETPSDRVLRQALNAMAAAPEIAWWIIPGNHDSLAAEALWERLRRDAPPNVHPLDRAAPVAMAENVMLLPAPATHRYPGLDLTEWMAAAETPDGAFRIGLAHGAVQSFGSEDGSAEVIPPDRAETARLDYLALGDWHGAMRVGPRTHYAGTPERDRFKHDGPGVCLSVCLPAPGALPEVVEVPVGRFDWSRIELALTPDTDPEAALEQALPRGGAARADRLIQLRVSGWTTPERRLALDRALAALAPDFCHFEVEDDRLATEYGTADLEAIDAGGALRLAADTLLTEARNGDLPAEERRIAEAALNRLYGLLQETQAPG